MATAAAAVKAEKENVMTGRKGEASRLDARVLDDLFAVVESRRDADPESSWTARLLNADPAVVARKVGEEAVETVVEALRGDRERVVEESADLLYHLLVLWCRQGLAPEQVWAALARRRGASGLAEKAARNAEPGA